MVIKVADGENRREFRYYCRLAVKITDDKFEKLIAEKALNPPFDSKGKYTYLLDFIRKHKGK